MIVTKRHSLQQACLIFMAALSHPYFDIYTVPLGLPDLSGGRMVMASDNLLDRQLVNIKNKYKKVKGIVVSFHLLCL